MSYAAFRATRELVGLTQSALADALGVRVRSVKRWESPDAPQQAPEAAWAVLNAALDSQRLAVSAAVAGAGPSERIRLRYWTSQGEYDEARNDGGDWRTANATARAIAAALMAEGRAVEWCADDGR